MSAQVLQLGNDQGAVERRKIRLRRGAVKLPTPMNPAQRIFPEWEEVTELGGQRVLVARCPRGDILATPNQNGIIAGTLYCKPCKAFFIVS